MSGIWLGLGIHRLFEGDISGHGFTLPGWMYPLVLQDDGELAYD